MQLLSALPPQTDGGPVWNGNASGRLAIDFLALLLSGVGPSTDPVDPRGQGSLPAGGARRASSRPGTLKREADEDSAKKRKPGDPVHGLPVMVDPRFLQQQSPPPVPLTPMQVGLAAPDPAAGQTTSPDSEQAQAPDDDPKTAPQPGHDEEKRSGQPAAGVFLATFPQFIAPGMQPPALNPPPSVSQPGPGQTEARRTPASPTETANLPPGFELTTAGPKAAPARTEGASAEVAFSLRLSYPDRSEGATRSPSAADAKTSTDDVAGAAQPVDMRPLETKPPDAASGTRADADTRGAVSPQAPSNPRRIPSSDPQMAVHAVEVPQPSSPSQTAADQNGNSDSSREQTGPPTNRRSRSRTDGEDDTFDPVASSPETGRAIADRPPAVAAQSPAISRPERAPGAETPAPVRSTTPDVPPDVPKAAPLREISLKVPGAEDGGVDLHIVDSGGKLHVEVRTADTHLASSLRDNLGDLVGKLDSSGYRTEEISTHRDGAAVSAPDNSRQPAGDNGRRSGTEQDSMAGQGGNSGQQQHQGQGRGNRPRWLEEIVKNFDSAVREKENQN